MTDCACADDHQIRCRNKVDEKLHPDHLCDRCRRIKKAEDESP